MSDYVEVAGQNKYQDTMSTVSDIAEAARYSGIREILIRWGNWAREQPHTGYPIKSAGMGQNPTAGKCELCSDEEGLIVDKAVLALNVVDEEYYKVIFARYVINCTNKEGADYMGIPVRRYYENLASAEKSLSVALLSITSIFEA
jgi:hypothetical protein